jgi:ankyrin repeat protein
MSSRTNGPSLFSSEYDEVQKAIQSGQSLNQYNIDGDTPLHVANWGDRDEITALLLSSGADPNYANRKGGRVLEQACLLGNDIIALQLIQAGAQVNADQNSDQISPLYWAAYSKKALITRHLLRHGADYHYTSTREGTTPFETAINMRAFYYASEYLGSSKVMKCILKNKIPRAIRYIRKGKAAAPPSPIKITPLMLAAHLNSIEILRELIDTQCDLNAQDTLGRTAMHYAWYAHSHKAASLLAQAGARIDIEDRNRISVGIAKITSTHPYLA